MHFCQDEILALAMAIPVLRWCWNLALSIARRMR